MATREQWNKWMTEQSSSGLSIPQWCRERAIDTRKFYYWRERLGSTGSDVGKGSFVRVDRTEPVELLIGDDVRLRIPANFDQQTVKRLLEVLRC